MYRWALEKNHGGEILLKWDKKGALKALDSEKCFVCESIKPVYVVVTLHGKKDMHLPCCSPECAEVIAEIVAEMA